ncbi:MAG: hypothetical protein PHV02_13200 [Rhodocyclaceae bacterium]|nr:hypothetical protein [Rhodocyclaceae bacterium]
MASAEFAKIQSISAAAKAADKTWQVAGSSSTTRAMGRMNFTKEETQGKSESQKIRVNIL